MDTTDKQKKKPPQKPKAVNTAWVSLITVISFALSVVMSYISNEALASAGTILSFAVLLLFIALGIVFDMIGVASTSAIREGVSLDGGTPCARCARGGLDGAKRREGFQHLQRCGGRYLWHYLCATGALIVAHITSGVSAGLKVAVSLLITGLVSALTIGGKAAGKGIAVMCSGKVLALCGRVLSVLPLKLDNRK